MFILNVHIGISVLDRTHVFCFMNVSSRLNIKGTQPGEKSHPPVKGVGYLCVSIIRHVSVTSASRPLTSSLET